jgi:hypothetical protein
MNAIMQECRNIFKNLSPFKRFKIIAKVRLQIWQKWLYLKWRIFSLVVALLFLNGCRIVEVPVIVTVTKDSIVERVIMDTMFIYPKQENKTVSVDSSYLKTDLAFSWARIQPDGRLFHSIENVGKIPGKVVKNTTTVKKEIPKIIKIKETKTITKTKIKIKEVKVHDAFWWSGVVGWVALFGWFIFTVKKWLKWK